MHLSALEFSLLEFLVRHRGQVFSPDALLNRVWDSGSEAGPDMVRTMVKRIRNKLAEPEIIRNVFGEGYIVDKE
jgi:DNA-binding response OmpR family regulator